MDEELKTTTIWNEYEKGTDYMRMKNMFTNTEKNYNFFLGKQWENAKLGDMKPIVINVVKPIIKYKVGVINSNAYSVVFSPSYLQSNVQKANKICELLSKHVDRMWENQRMDRILRTIVKDACINSEGIIYKYYDEEEKEPKAEIVNKNNIRYGNEASEDIQDQPYIIIAFRKTVEEVKEEAIANDMSNDEVDLIVKDEELENEAGYDGINQEISPMCLVLLKLYKKKNKDGIKTVHFAKCTKYAEVVKEKDTGLKLYPVEHFIWESEKGSARGLGEVETNIPNQIEINKTQMRRAIAVKQLAYPKLAYNKTYITNPKSLTQTGAEIALEGAGVDDIRKYVGYINGTSMSADSKYLLDELVTYTQDLAGAGDNASGNVDVTKTSAKAILAVQQAQQQPLNEQLYKYKDFLEAIAKIDLDILQNYYIDGLVIQEEVEQQVLDYTGAPITNKVLENIPISYEELQELKANIKVDISSRTSYDKLAEEQSLTELFMSGQITFEEWVNALPYDSSYSKKKLEEIVKARQKVKEQIKQVEQQANAQMNSIQRLLMQQEQAQDIDNIQNDGQARIMQFQNALGGQ